MIVWFIFVWGFFGLFCFFKQNPVKVDVGSMPMFNKKTLKFANTFSDVSAEEASS